MLTPEEFTIVYQQGEHAQHDLILDIVKKAAALEDRTKLLEIQKNKNSTNSSKPPTSDRC